MLPGCDEARCVVSKAIYIYIYSSLLTLARPTYYGAAVVVAGAAVVVVGAGGAAVVVVGAAVDAAVTGGARQSGPE